MDKTQRSPKCKARCHNALGQGYSAKQAIADLDEALKRAARPLDPRNRDSKQTRSLGRW